MHGWALIPGIVLVAAGFLLQFGSWLRRPRDVALVFMGVRLRFIGFGALLLALGIDLGITALLGGPDPGMLAISLFILALAGTWFYAATDRIFSPHQRQ
jgi:hypothetical protein